MEFSNFFDSLPVLETGNLKLRAFEDKDMPEYQAIVKNERVQQYLCGGVKVLNSSEDAAKWLQRVNVEFIENSSRLIWCIEHDDKAIGRIELKNFYRDAMADVAYFLDDKYWNRGFATEAVTKVSEFAFQLLKLHRIQALVLPENAASIKALRKSGFVEEGVLRNFPFGSGYFDVVTMSKI